MHKKTIIIVLISMLLIIPVISSAEKVRLNRKEPDEDIVTSSADVPVWSVGDKWVYDMELAGDMGDAFEYDWQFDNIAYVVSDKSSTEYNLDLTGTITGEITISGLEIIKGKLKDTTISGQLVADTTNLGIKHADISIQGKIQIILITKDFSLDIDVEFTPSYYAVDFPISVGKTWTTTLSDVDGTMDFSLFNDPFYISDIVGGDNAECTETISKTVQAGTFSSYKIITDGDVEEFFYAEDAGNIISAIGAISQDIDVELVSTTYSPGEPGAPNKPSTPTGPGSGGPGKSLSYTSSTTDNEGDQIYYWFDWGDGSNSGWQGPFNSGESCTQSHVWNSKGTYSIKVKAKDTEDHVSVWSESLTVSMPRSRNIQRTSTFLKIIENLPLIYKKTFSNFL